MRNPMIFFKSVKAGTISQAKVRKILHQDAMTIAAEMMLDLTVTTATWKHKVKFKRIVEIKGDGITILVGTDDQIWQWLNEGTQDHVILPKNKPMLHFQNTYTAKTIPGLLTARPGGKSGDWVHSKGTIVSGIEPRKWDEALADRWKYKFPKAIERSITTALALAVEKGAK